MNIPSDTQLRSDIIRKDRERRRKRLKELESDISGLRAITLDHGRSLMELGAKIAIAEGHVRYMQREEMQDGTTVRLPILRPTTNPSG